MSTQRFPFLIGIVAAARGLDVESLMAGVADGRVVTGADALKEKLIDQTGYIEDAYAAAAEEAGISDPTVVQYIGRPGLFGFLRALGSTEAEGAGATARKVEIDLSKLPMPGGR